MQLKKTIDQLVKNAGLALENYINFGQSQVDEIVRKVALKAAEKHEDFAKKAFLETKRGVLKDKIAKDLFASKDVFNYIKDKKTVGVIRRDEKSGCTEIADPLGVIAAVTPVTNPTSTTIFKALICLKTRNPVIFGFHPGAKKCCIETAEFLSRAAEEAGAPKNCIQWIAQPSVEATSMLMNHEGVDVILATGGSGMVKAAYSAGKAALGVGPGNVPCYVEKTADLNRACEDIILSKTFDNGMICASEQALIVDAEISARFQSIMQSCGCYFLSNSQKQKLSDFAFDRKSGKINPEIVGKSALEISRAVGLDIPQGTKVLVVRLNAVGKQEPLSAEKLSPILAYYEAKSTQDALRICEEVLNIGDKGHTAVIHSENGELIEKFGLKMQAGRVLVNTPSSQGAIGGIYNSNTPSLTLGCGSHGRNSISSNVSVENLINLKKIFLRKPGI